MRVSDIKMGDWFEFGEGQGQISLIYGDTVTINGYQPNIAELQPIPLTKEILEKNRWEFISNEMWYKIEPSGIEISLWDSKKDKWAVHIQGEFTSIIRYVHELQHLLWALGVDDNLKL